MTQKMVIKYIRAGKEHAEKVFELVQDTITTIYPNYYRKEIVDFFCQLHNKENIVKDIESGNVHVLLHNNQAIGTGSYENNYITRVYVHPQFQKKGHGSFIMQSLESELALKYDTVYLDASLPAVRLYENLGYTTKRHESFTVENGIILVYEIMQKNFLF